MVYVCILAYMTLYVAYMGAFAASPNDSMFFHTFLSNFGDGWAFKMASAALEIYILTSSAGPPIFGLLAVMSYIDGMSWLTR